MQGFKTKNLKFLLLLLYFISISAHQLGTGFDSIFVRLIFIVLLIISIISSKKIRINGQIKWCICFWGYYFLSMLWADNPNDTMYYFNNFIQILGISICIPLIVENEKDIKTIMNLFIISMFYTIFLVIIRTPANAWGSDRIGSVVGLSPNGLGMRTAIASAFAYFLLKNNIKSPSKVSLKKIYYLVVIITMFVISLFTGSKKALFISIFLIVFYELITTKGIKFLLKTCLLFILSIGIIYFTISNETLYPIIGRRLEKTILTITGDAKTRDLDTSLIERNYYIDEAIKMFKESPVIGSGGNNFVTRMTTIKYKHVAYSHNNFVELLSTLGIIGFLIYYYIWIKTIIVLYKKYRLSKNNIMLFFMLVLITLLIFGYWNVNYISEFTTIIVVISYILAKITQEKKMNDE